MTWFLYLLAAIHFQPTWAAQPQDPARAHWLEKQKIEFIYPADLQIQSNLRFYLSADLRIPLSVIEIAGGKVILSVPSLSEKEYEQVLQSRLLLLTESAQNRSLDMTGVQIAGVLDELYATNEKLGLQWKKEQPCVKLWAPTAQKVELLIYQKDTDIDFTQKIELQRQQGLWTGCASTPSKEQYYLYRVTVFNPRTQNVETHTVTDPYSVSLSLNSQKSQFLNLEDSAWKPKNWGLLSQPRSQSHSKSAATSAVIYELHLRDATANDLQLPRELRGTFLGLVDPRSQVYKHLQKLADAGVTHLHLLPFNDFASVNEDKTTWQNYEGSFLSVFDLQKPQAEIQKIRSKDPYNWGYDPVHYLVPEGSYSTNANGGQRALEFRQMILKLKQMGFKVVQDVVFNHTYSHGTDAFSVLDQIVPLYYYRLDSKGNVQNSSCCSDTASENKMMEKLMLDAVVFWAKAYQLDGFRFDLMSFHTVSNMKKIKEAVLKVVPDVLLYGEGWKFGSLVDKYPTQAMTFENSYGQGFGIFNDRFRDAIRGGTPHSSEKSDQGFATGLWSAFNNEPANQNTPASMEAQKEKLLHLADVIKVGFVGNLRDMTFRDHKGNTISGGQLFFRGQPTGFAATPFESINYVSAHDGYTLWDGIQAKFSFTQSKIEERIRAHRLALALTLLSRGIPFIESGSEILRSKSGDQNSYDSGDYFNFIDYSLKKNGWGLGLPGAWQNQNDWSFWQPRLLRSDFKVTSQQQQETLDYVLALLKTRKNSPQLISSDTFDFIDDLREPHPGVIAIRYVGPEKDLLIYFNALPTSTTLLLPKNYSSLHLSPYLNAQVDPVLAQVEWSLQTWPQIVIPAQTTAVIEATP